MRKTKNNQKREHGCDILGYISCKWGQQNVLNKFVVRQEGSLGQFSFLATSLTKPVQWRQ